MCNFRRLPPSLSLELTNTFLNVSTTNLATVWSKSKILGICLFKLEINEVITNPWVNPFQLTKYWSAPNLGQLCLVRSLPFFTTKDCCLMKVAASRSC